MGFEQKKERGTDPRDRPRGLSPLFLFTISFRMNYIVRETFCFVRADTSFIDA